MRVLVIGAGGHSREVADLVVESGHEIAGFVDEAVSGPHRPTGLPVVRSVGELDADAVTIAVGDVHARERLFEGLEASYALPVLVYSSAGVSPYATIGDGCQVMQNVVVNSSAVVGVNVILNVGCAVMHDCRVGDHSHIAPGVQLGGGAVVGARTLVGSGAVVLPGVTVGADCVVGAGAVVTSDVPDGERVAGVPARAVRGDVR
ncbi:MAG: NeuD/PglB/VioB family sugar acetyltransferase [Coriobacteriia bacterium]|nr:NeuD/PglB/VioB family sugar acetyltransferase [Coriobacteriia bacterium]